jgi:hypothetical protein
MDMDMDVDMDMDMDTDMDTDTDTDMDTDTDTNTALRPQLNTVSILYGAALYRTAAVRYTPIPSVGLIKQSWISCVTSSP